MERGPDTAPRTVYSPKSTRPRHRMIVMMAEAGWTNNDIAGALGYTAGRVSIIVKSRNPELLQLRVGFAQTVADNIVDVQSRLKLYANEMVTRMVDHARQSTDIAQSRLAARDILHMAGFAPIKKQLTLQATAPVEELKGVIGDIMKANQAAEKAVEYIIQEPEVSVADG